MLGLNFNMPAYTQYLKHIEWLPFKWLIRHLHQQTVEQVSLIKWPSGRTISQPGEEKKFMPLPAPQGLNE